MKLKLSGLMAAALLISITHAEARECELPHEWLQPQCRSASELESVSGVEKPRKRDIKQVVANYRGKSRAFTSIVEKAEEDFQAYRARKRATQLPK